MAADRDYFIDVFEEIVAAVRLEYDTVNNLEPYFTYGHPREIANKLSLKDQNAVDKFRKWPLIALITDLEQNFNDDPNIYYELSPFTVLIVVNTIKTYTSEERTVNTLKPILYPIKKLLIEKIIESKAIYAPRQKIKYKQIDKYGWGNETVYGNTGLIFNSFLDAIEITPSEIKVYPNQYECSTIKPA